MKKHRHQILTLDVWGNARDGWEINNMYPYGESVDLSDDMTDAQILRATSIAMGGGSAAGLEVEADMAIGDGDIYICVKKNGKPVVALRPR
jgi:hypothetical protein